MKKIICILLVSSLVAGAAGQRSIDNLFRRYAGSEGFTTITISGDLLNFVKSNDSDQDNDLLPCEINEIRILAQKDHKLEVENFYNHIIKDINLSDYEEFMRVRDSDQNLQMLVRKSGNRFREFLLIAGGEDNFVIQIKGSMTLREAKKMAHNFSHDHGKRCLTAVCE